MRRFRPGRLCSHQGSADEATLGRHKWLRQGYSIFGLDREAEETARKI